MKERKLKDDFAVEVSMDERGRDRRKAFYRGDYYSLPFKAEERKAFFRRSIVMYAVYVLLYLIYMLLSTPSTYCIYVLPFASAGILPLAYWTLGMVGMLRAPHRMTSVQKEKGVGRVMRSSLGCMVLTMMAAVGDLIFLMRTADKTAEMPGLALLLCMAATALAALRHARAAYHELFVEQGRTEAKNK